MRSPYAPVESKNQRAAIRATLTGPDTCTALGLTATGSSPVLSLCRQLLAKGVDPNRPLEAWRGPVICLRVVSIGIGARLEINAYGTGFRPRREADAAPPIAPNAPARTGDRATHEAAE